MDVRSINNYFGDMDLILMDYILKGFIPDEAKVLDAGCGEGRNAVYFLQKGYDFLGMDNDASKIRLAQYLSNNISTSKGRFEVNDLRNLVSLDSYDLILCSRVLHFAENVADFLGLWEILRNRVNPGGLIYLSMDSIIENSTGTKLKEGKYKFLDAAIRFALTEELYEEIKKGFIEIEPLKTIIQHGVRAQSFVLLKKA